MPCAESPEPRPGDRSTGTKTDLVDDTDGSIDDRNSYGKDPTYPGNRTPPRTEAPPGTFASRYARPHRRAETEEGAHRGGPRPQTRRPARSCTV